MSNRLIGKQIPITVPALKKLIGTKVNYLLNRDIDRSGRGCFFPQKGTITEIYRRHVDFGNGELMAFSQINEIAEYTLSKESILKKLGEGTVEFKYKKDNLAVEYYRILAEAIKLNYTCNDGNIAVEISKIILQNEGKKNYDLWLALYDPQDSLVRTIAELRFMEDPISDECRTRSNSKRNSKDSWEYTLYA